MGKKQIFSPHESHTQAGWCSAVQVAEARALLHRTLSSGQKMPTNTPLLPARTRPSAFVPWSRQGHGQRSSAPVGRHHLSIIPCKLTRRLAALHCPHPCLPLLQGRVLRQHCSCALANAGAGSPAMAARHVYIVRRCAGCLHPLPKLDLPPHPLAQGGPAHPAPETSRSCPSPQRSRSSRPPHAGAGQHTLPNRPADPSQRREGGKATGPKRPLIRLQPHSAHLQMQSQAGLSRVQKWGVHGRHEDVGSSLGNAFR